MENFDKETKKQESSDLCGSIAERPLSPISFEYTSPAFKEMNSIGKGLPVSVDGLWTKVKGLRHPSKYLVSTYTPNQLENLETLEGDEDETITKSFVTGNPFVETVHGLLHLYKDNDNLYYEPKKPTPRSEMLCILAIPSTIGCSDLLRFIAPARSTIQHIKIIRDTEPNSYMALIKFKKQVDADAFFNEFNGERYNLIEKNVCALAYVSRVEAIKNTDSKAGLPLSGHTELPTCPVCLERMDESVEGLLTILCNHSFHTSCLSKWNESGCPVCRYVQTPEMVDKNACVECNSQEQLWICLICGHVGCGRYVQGHAYKHFCETHHTYAIQPDNNRVWDYVGDNFVHRLLQNQSDGKLVESAGRSGACNSCAFVYNGHEFNSAEEKVDNLHLEFNHMLTSELETQRNYFEERIRVIESSKGKELEEAMTLIKALQIERDEAEGKYKALQKEKAICDKKMRQMSDKFEKKRTELESSVEMVRSLNENLEFFKKRVDELSDELEEHRRVSSSKIVELEETVRDLSLYIEGSKLIAESDEGMEGGSIALPPPPPPPPPPPIEKKRKGKKN